MKNASRHLVNWFLVAGAMGTAIVGVSSKALGCTWYDRYELQGAITSTPLAGTYACRRVAPAGYLCDFIATENPDLHFVMPPQTQPLSSDDLPPVGETWETDYTMAAMHWLDCDGTDPTPTFQANGVMHSILWRKRSLTIFVPRKLRIGSQR